MNSAQKRKMKLEFFDRGFFCAIDSLGQLMDVSTTDKDKKISINDFKFMMGEVLEQYKSETAQQKMLKVIK